jgi:branched-chain amino acid transport system permease protein
MNWSIDRRVIVAGVIMLLLALLPLLAAWLEQDFYIGQLRRVLIIAIAAVSLDIILGYGGMVSLGHAAFLGAGAYVVAALHWHADRNLAIFGWLPASMDSLVTIPLAMAVAAVLALVIGAISLRTTGLYFIMITLAFAQMLYFLFVSLRFDDDGRNYGGDDGLRYPSDVLLFRIVGTDNELGFYFVVWTLLAMVLFVGHRLTRARFGLALQGIRDNERRMRALGFATRRYKLAAFVLAGAIAGLSGALLALHESYVSPSLMHWTRSGDLVVMVVLGGMGTLSGPVLGAAVFLLLEKFLPDYTEHWMLIFGPVLVLVVLFAKHGLIGLIETRRDPKEGAHG